MEEDNKVLQEENKEQEKDNIKSIDILQQESTNCLALMVKEEYKMTVVKNVVTKSIKVSWKIALNILIINFLNLFL